MSEQNRLLVRLFIGELNTVLLTSPISIEDKMYVGHLISGLDISPSANLVLNHLTNLSDSKITLRTEGRKIKVYNHKLLFIKEFNL